MSRRKDFWLWWAKRRQDIAIRRYCCTPHVNSLNPLGGRQRSQQKGRKRPQAVVRLGNKGRGMANPQKMEAHGDLDYDRSSPCFAILSVPHLANSKLQPDALLGGAMCRCWPSSRSLCDRRFTRRALYCRATGCSDLFTFIRGIDGRATA